MTKNFLFALALFTTTAIHMAHAQEPKTPTKVDDVDVDTDSVVRFDNYFMPWGKSFSISDRVEISSLRVGSEFMAGTIAATLGHKMASYSAAHSRLLRMQLGTTRNAPIVGKLKLKTRAGQLGATLGNGLALLLFVDAISGSVIAYYGNKPLYTGNLYALGRYLHDTINAPMPTYRPLNSRERDDLNTLQDQLDQALQEPTK